MTIFSGCVDDPGTVDWVTATRSGSKSSMPMPSSFSSSDKSLLHTNVSVHGSNCEPNMQALYITLPVDCVLGSELTGAVGLGGGVNEILSNSNADAKYGFVLLGVVDDGEGEGALDGGEGEEALDDGDSAGLFVVSCSSSDADSDRSFFFLLFLTLAAFLGGIKSSSSDSTKPKALPM